MGALSLRARLVYLRSSGCVESFAFDNGVFRHLRGHMKVKTPGRCGLALCSYAFSMLGGMVTLIWQKPDFRS